MKITKNYVYIFLAIIITIVNNFVLPYFKLATSIQILISELALIGVSIIVIWLFNSKAESDKNLMRQPYCFKRNIITKLLISIPCIIACGFLSLIISDSIVILTGGIVNTPEKLDIDGLGLFLLIFSSAFVPCIMEELWYRKIPMEMDNNVLIVLATTSFLANHQGISSIINAFVIAISTILIYKLTKCIYVCMGTHFIFNLSLIIENNITQFFSIKKIMSLFMSKNEHILFLLICLFMFLIVFALIIFLLKPISSTSTTKIKSKFRIKIIETIVILFFVAIALMNLFY